MQSRHGVPVSAWWLSSTPLWARRQWQGNTDASLCARDAGAKRAGAQRVYTLRGGFLDNGEKRGVRIRAGESVCRLPHSSGCRGRSPRRCAPARHNAHSYTADRSCRLPSSTPHAALDNAAHCGHKGKWNAPSYARACRRPGVLSRNVPGPSFIRRPGLRIAHTASRSTRRIAHIASVTSTTHSV